MERVLVFIMFTNVSAASMQTYTPQEQDRVGQNSDRPKRNWERQNTEKEKGKETRKKRTEARMHALCLSLLLGCKTHGRDEKVKETNKDREGRETRDTWKRRTEMRKRRQEDKREMRQK